MRPYCSCYKLSCFSINVIIYSHFVLIIAFKYIHIRTVVIYPNLQGNIQHKPEKVLKRL